MTIKDVDAYFLYHKNSATGVLTNFERQMKKPKNSAMKDLLRTLNKMSYKRNPHIVTLDAIVCHQWDKMS